jgi:catechol 2,3-dioxygenase-like lactoylglutathione lyase family enzyme
MRVPRAGVPGNGGWHTVAMAVRSLGWMGVRTPHAGAMNTFYREVLRLEVILDRPGATWYRLADGAEVHVYGPPDEFHGFFGDGPVVGFAVDSFRETYENLTAARAEFVYPEPQRADGRAWQHFRAPDGNVYEIIGPDDLPEPAVVPDGSDP